MFALVFVVFYVKMIFLYSWAMSFDILGVSVFIEALIFVLILIVHLFPLLNRTAQNLVISTILYDLSKWSGLSSLWSLLYGSSCCFIEFASLIGSRFDFDRYGLVPRSTGIVIMKMAPSLVRLYDQLVLGHILTTCTITGGMFSIDSYSTIRGVNKLIPVDVYLPSCPPKPKAVIDAIAKLRKKISREIYEDRIGDLLPITSFMLDVVFILEIMINDSFINPHRLLLQRYLLKLFSNIKHGLIHRSLGFDYQGIETLQIKSEDWHSIAVILYVSGYNYLRSQCTYDVAPGGLLASVYHFTRIEYGVEQPEEVCIKVFT
ncbi:hypothetical protein M9H77_30278 [Catharanthus roseus]|uniref:Uncharacterized protein n=1 Tax=Catharanthus roseus TaxID=4058 RepID=A0ACB9ZXP5_CATRO|nr:hypothetical protein M9H77_30278 [Catharanthus roseus]